MGTHTSKTLAANGSQGLPHGQQSSSLKPGLFSKLFGPSHAAKSQPQPARNRAHRGNLDSGPIHQYQGHWPLLVKGFGTVNTVTLSSSISFLHTARWKSWYRALDITEHTRTSRPWQNRRRVSRRAWPPLPRGLPTLAHRQVSWRELPQHEWPWVAWHVWRLSTMSTMAMMMTKKVRMAFNTIPSMAQSLRLKLILRSMQYPVATIEVAAKQERRMKSRRKPDLSSDLGSARITLKRTKVTTQMPSPRVKLASTWTGDLTTSTKMIAVPHLMVTMTFADTN